MSDTFDHFLKQQDALRAHADPLSDVRRRLEGLTTLHRFHDPLEDLKQRAAGLTDLHRRFAVGSEALAALRQNQEHQRLFQSQLGGIAVSRLGQELEIQAKLARDAAEQLSKFGMLDRISDNSRFLAITAGCGIGFKEPFSIPEPALAAQLAQLAVATSRLTQSAFGQQQASMIAAAMQRMTKPWLELEHQARSARAFGDLMSLGQGIAARAPYDDQWSQALRQGLGDWRERIALTLPEWIDRPQRLAFYDDRGVDPALTNFTFPAFDQAVTISGLRRPSDELADENDALDEQARSKQAYAYLLELEVEIRKFIVCVMENTFGATWMQRQLPPGMLDRWIEKQDHAADSGMKKEVLINYADFTDYKVIIEMRGNWNSVFKYYFVRPENIRESFQRMFPLRVAVMHARIIAPDDSILLMVETKRIMKAIRAKL